MNNNPNLPVGSENLMDCVVFIKVDVVIVNVSIIVTDDVCFIEVVVVCIVVVDVEVNDQLVILIDNVSLVDDGSEKSIMHDT